LLIGGFGTTASIDAFSVKNKMYSPTKTVTNLGSGTTIKGGISKSYKGAGRVIGNITSKLV
jgi:hypothetical protein